MATQKTKDILFYIETEVQFDSIKPLLFHIRDETKLSFDIVVPAAASKGTSINKEIYESAANALLTNKFNITRSVDDVVLPDSITSKKYKIFMSAYIYPWHYYNVNANYRIMFPYASYYFNKPNWTVDRFIIQDFQADALLSHAVGTQRVTDIFTKTHIVPSLKLMDYKNKPNRTDKPVLFFAPTYNELDFAVDFLEDIEKLKEEFTIIIRDHHRVSHIKANKEIARKLYEVADRVYDADEYPLTMPLGEADIVITDNSAVIFDAIYCKVPVALFSKDTNSFSYKDMSTTQSELVKSGDLLWTNNPKELALIAKQTLTKTMRKKQERMSLHLFPAQESINPVLDWMKVLRIYIDDDLPRSYSLAKKYWIENINQKTRDIESMQREIEGLKWQISERDINIAKEQNPGIKTSATRLSKAVLRKFHTVKRSK